MNAPIKSQKEKTKFKPYPCCTEGTMNTFLMLGKSGIMFETKRGNELRSSHLFF